MACGHVTKHDSILVFASQYILHEPLIESYEAWGEVGVRVSVGQGADVGRGVGLGQGLGLGQGQVWSWVQS